MMFGATFAPFLGGFAHALFPNRASDGTGQLSFYLTVAIG